MNRFCEIAIISACGLTPGGGDGTLGRIGLGHNAFSANAVAVVSAVFVNRSLRADPTHLPRSPYPASWFVRYRCLTSQAEYVIISDMDENKPLGAYLKQVRESQGLSLRDVQSKTGVSNAFLSQIESGKVKEPSPVMLHKLATLYRVSYEDLMDRAGYPTPAPTLPAQRTGAVFQRFGDITSEEEEQLLDYLGFLRSRARRGRK